MAEEPGMDKADLRKLLVVAKKTPVNAAMGMSKDGMPIMLLHKTIKPRVLSKQLELANQGLNNVRWGELYVDEEKDPKTLVARLNKPSSGLARKLIKAVKFAGFSKVVLQFEDGTIEEGGDEEAAEEAAPDAAPKQAAPAAAPQEPPPAQPAADLGPVTERVTALVKRMLPLIASDSSHGDTLKPLAKSAQGAIQNQVLAAAQTAADLLEKAIAGIEGAAPAAPEAAAQAVDPVATKARATWIAVRQRVDGELNKLLAAVRTTYQDHGGLAEIEKRVQKELDGVLNALDEELSHKLEEMGKATASERAKLAEEAKQIAARYQQHIANDKILGALDDNPFVPLSVQKTVTAALSAIVRNIH